METGKIVKTFQSKKGNKVVIRYLRWEDLNNLLEYANKLSKENTFVLLSGEEVTLDEEIKYVSKSLGRMAKNEKVHMVAEINGTFAGNAEINRYTRRQKHAGDVAISIAREFREEGIGTIFLETLIDEGKKLGLTLLTIDCMENNDRAIHVYEKVGFIRIGVIPSMNKYNGKYVGLVKFYLPLV